MFLVHQENHKAQKLLEETANVQNEDHQPRIVPKDAAMNAKSVFYFINSICSIF